MYSGNPPWSFSAKRMLGMALLYWSPDMTPQEFMAMQSLRWLLMGIVKVHQLAASHATLII